jgi:hypothetical protein
MDAEKEKPKTLVLDDGHAREIYVSTDGEMLEIDDNVFTKKEAAQLRDFINAFLGEKMDAEQVCEMIDTITEGRNYDLEIKGANDTGECRLQFASGSFSLALLEGWATEIDDPRTAREIAAALIAWANHKDGIVFDQLTAAANLAAMRKSPTAPTVEDWAEIKSGRSSREEWYRRNVERMSLETLKRNKEDLKGIRANLPTHSPTRETDWADINKAINIINDELLKRDQG